MSVHVYVDRLTWAVALIRNEKFHFSEALFVADETNKFCISLQTPQQKRMNNKTNNLTGIQSNKIDSMCFDIVFLCARTDEIHLFTIRPLFPRKTERLTPDALWLSSNSSTSWHRSMAMPYGYYQSNLLYNFFFLVSFLIWWLIDEFNFVKPILYSSKWKSFLAFIHEQWNSFAFNENWRWLLEDAYEDKV